MDGEPEEIQLQSGYYFSPGFYMQYWQAVILPGFDAETVAFGGILKQHREAWIGAQLAAMKTKLSGEKHFFALPERDPPDVLVGTFKPITTPLGRTGHDLDWYPIENTRCDMSQGEELLGQIGNKNTAAYSSTVLLVYLQGAEVVPDMQAVHRELMSLDIVHLHEIIVMVQLQPQSEDNPADTFGFVQVYLNYDTVVIDRSDPDAYFKEPNIMRITGRGVQEAARHLGSVRLMPPERIGL